MALKPRPCFSQYQLIPYQRVQEQFQDQFQLPISVGSIFEFNQQAYTLLEQFELKLIPKMLFSSVLHADETGININGKNHWLHKANILGRKILSQSACLRKSKGVGLAYF